MKWFAFVPINELDAYKWQKLQEEQRARDAQNIEDLGKLAQAIGFVAVGVATFVGVYALSNYNSHSSGNSYSNSSSNSAKKVVFKVTDTIGCIKTDDIISSYNLSIYVNGEFEESAILHTRKDNCWYHDCQAQGFMNNTKNKSLEEACEHYYIKILGRSASSVRLEKKN